MRLISALAVATALALILAGTGAGQSVAKTVDPQEFVGQWTPDGTSTADLAGHYFDFSITTEDQAKAAVNRDPSDPNFDSYCKSTDTSLQPITYFIFSYSWDGGGEMGGCHSTKTGPHVYMWGNYEFDVGYAFLTTVHGEPVLKGQWTASGQNRIFRAHHPEVTFLTHDRYTEIVKKKTHDVEHVNVAGTGKLHVIYQPENCHRADVVSADGALTVNIARLGGKRDVELSDVKVDLEPGGQWYPCDESPALFSVPIVVKSSDPSEHDPCKDGSTGTLSLVDSSPSEGDIISLKVPKCDIAIKASTKTVKKGSHVAVALELNLNGY